MILSFSDFLANNAVVIILIILGLILGVIGYLKRTVLAKYLPREEEDQTPEEILQDELDNILITEKYVPENRMKKKDILDDYDDDDFDYDHQEEKKENNNNDEFLINDSSSYSFLTEEDKEK